MLDPRRARTRKNNPRTARAYLARGELTSSRLRRARCALLGGRPGAHRPASEIRFAPCLGVRPANFIITGSLVGIAAHGLARSPKQTAGPRVVQALTFAVGGGLIGSGLFVTDPVAGYPLSPSDRDEADRTRPVVPTREGTLHNLCATPILVGIPIAAMTSGTSAARRGHYRWASYSAGSAIAMGSATALFGAAFGGAPRLARHGGLLQRLSIATGLGWLSARSLRALTSALPAC
jgi:hypothetical protein